MGNTQYLAVLGEQSQHLCRLNVVLTQVQSNGISKDLLSTTLIPHERTQRGLRLQLP